MVPVPVPVSASATAEFAALLLKEIFPYAVPLIFGTHGDLQILRRSSRSL